MNNYIARVTLPEIKGSLLLNKDEENWKWNFQEMKLDSRQKIVLLGESVAAGYFYRPAITLGKLFQEVFPNEQLIDLSRIDLPFEKLKDFHAVVASLKPSKIIIFAGNNFTPTLETNYSDLLENQLGWVRTLPHTETIIIIPKFNSRWMDDFTGKEHLSPRIVPELQKALREYQAEIIEAPSDKFLLDYCHYSWEGLRNIVEVASGKNITTKLNDLSRIESLKNAFLHCYRYGQTSLALGHLAALEEIMIRDKFSKFITSFLEGILFRGNPLFLEDFLREVFGREASDLSAPSEDFYEMYYPEKELFDYLLAKALNPKVLQQKVINLLLPVRIDVSLRKVDKHLFRDPSLHFYVEDKCITRFLKNEISGQKFKLHWRSAGQELKVLLNGEELTNLEFARERLEDYNEIQILGDGAFSLEELRLLGE